MRVVAIGACVLAMGCGGSVGATNPDGGAVIETGCVTIDAGTMSACSDSAHWIWFEADADAFRPCDDPCPSGSWCMTGKWPDTHAGVCN